MENVTVTVAGASFFTNFTGRYEMTVITGNYYITAIKEGYQTAAQNITIQTGVPLEYNLTLIRINTSVGIDLKQGFIFGIVKDNKTGFPLEDAIVSISGNSFTTNETGNYSLTSTTGPHKIVATRLGYDAYVNDVTINESVYLEHNIYLSQTQPQLTSTSTSTSSSSATSTLNDVGPNIGPSFQTMEEKPGKIVEYLMTLKKIKERLRFGTFIKRYFQIDNYKDTEMHLKFDTLGDINDILKVNQKEVIIPPNGSIELELTILGNKKPGVYQGTFFVDGDFNETIPVEITILEEEKMPIEALLIRLTPIEKEIMIGTPVKFKVDLYNLLTDQTYDVKINYDLKSMNVSNATFTLETDQIKLQTSHTIIKTFYPPEDIPTGDYVITARAEYLNLSSIVTSVITIKRPFYRYALFGFLPVWTLLPIILSLVIGTAAYSIIRKKMEAKKKYHTAVEQNLIPQEGQRSIRVGKIAETTKRAYIDIDRLTTHCIIAGSTGGGKTVAAQDIIEECLDKGIAVIVFDPTAQWTGMLRKQDNKKMLAMFKDFGLDPKKDAKGYPGNIKPITNALQKIKLNDYMKPGEIQVFTINTLDPKDIDIFVANTVTEIFHSNLQEAQELKVMVVYDEVHRLLPKFGGSGEGFIQIERACREFRKWGIGVMLISQVLADFVGQIKANINTELQMRTRDEGDLERIKTKYGADLLQSLVKASTGTGMIQNSEWNRGKPYFISFRPLKHNVKRLGDEELTLYDNYNKEIDQLKYELLQLKEENLDVYDLELELKLALDKVKTGNFNITQIYLDEMRVRLEKMWKGVGKEPLKFEIELVKREEIEAELKAAKKAKEDAEKANGVKVEEKKEEKETTIVNVKPLLLDNGQIIQTTEELMDSLRSMDIQIFRGHVSDKKNDIVKWVREQIKDEILAERILPITSKKDLLVSIQTYYAEKKKAQEKVSKETVK